MLDNKKVKYSKMLDISVNDFDEFVKRYMYFLLAQDKITKKSIVNGFFILDEIVEKNIIAKIQEEKQKYKSKNIIIRKYINEIVELYKDGLGDIKIAKTININHKTKLTQHMIRNFIRANKIKRDA